MKPKVKPEEAAEVIGFALLASSNITPRRAWLHHKGVGMTVAGVGRTHKAAHRDAAVKAVAAWAKLQEQTKAMIEASGL